MGLIAAAMGSVGGVLADQWKEYFYCDSLPDDVLVRKGVHRTSGRSTNTKGTDNIITNGSVIAVADNQCMVIVDQGKIAEVCAVPGEFVYDSSTEPSIFSGKLGDSIKQTFAAIGKRFTFGGEVPHDQRVYYINTREIKSNKYGTPNPVPFRVVDLNIGLDTDISVKCFGEYSYHIVDPILFYTNVCGNTAGDYTRDRLDSQMKTELLTALQPAFARISEMGIRYSAVPGHTKELAKALNEELSADWREIRGIEIVSFGVSSLKADEEDEKRIKDLQMNATLRDPNMRAAQMAGNLGEAMKTAAGNTATGPAMAFMGVGMAQNAMGGMTNYYDPNYQHQNAYATAPGGGYGQPAYPQQPAQPQAPAAPAAPAADTWTCPTCGKQAAGKFCTECGTKKPEPVKMAPAGTWICPNCGKEASGNFCMECGTKKPEQKKYKCSNCGFEPADPANPPKFCPNCGNAFGDEDLV